MRAEASSVGPCTVRMGSCSATPFAFVLLCLVNAFLSIDPAPQLIKDLVDYSRCPRDLSFVVSRVHTNRVVSFATAMFAIRLTTELTRHRPQSVVRKPISANWVFRLLRCVASSMLARLILVSLMVSNSLVSSRRFAKDDAHAAWPNNARVVCEPAR